MLKTIDSLEVSLILEQFIQILISKEKKIVDIKQQVKITRNLSPSLTIAQSTSAKIFPATNLEVNKKKKNRIKEKKLVQSSPQPLIENINMAQNH